MDKQKVGIKDYVKQKYADIAKQSKATNESSCCGATATADGTDYTMFSDNYEGQQGYVEEADLGLGCGIPTEGAHIEEGHTVLDLGSGAGNDCFVARSMVGETGHVIGIDFSREMVDKAIRNKEKLGYENMTFLEGDIDNMPLGNDAVDVILSNCVLNLVPEKRQAFQEMYRVLRQGGHFSISDIVIHGELPENLIKDASLYAGCITGALQEKDYLDGIRDAGFRDVRVVKRKQIELPEAMLTQYLNDEEIRQFKEGEVGIHSITVSGMK
jgi:ubiquinone/menaquinone biosynthesis C-methylase UbiE